MYGIKLLNKDLNPGRKPEKTRGDMRRDVSTTWTVNPPGYRFLFLVKFKFNKITLKETTLR